MEITKFNLKNNGLLLGSVRFNQAAFQQYCSNKKCSTIYTITNIFDNKTELIVKDDFIPLLKIFLKYQEI